jgi:hypothetical protein
MTEYHMHGLTLSLGQVNKIVNAAKKHSSVKIRLTTNNLQGSHKLPLTQRQIDRINIGSGMDLTLSYSQIKHLNTIVSDLEKKHGGFLPLLALLPAIFGGLGAAGGLAGGIASAVSSANNAKAGRAAQAEAERHNREVEAQLKAGAGVVSDAVGKIPVIGNYLKPLLQKIGLGVVDCNTIMNGGCVCMGKRGGGLYIGPAGGGLYIGPQSTAQQPQR